MSKFAVTIPSSMMFAWEGQKSQYPETGLPGIWYFRGDVSEIVGKKAHVDCLLYRHTDGDLIGILNYYPQDLPPFEKQGNINVWVSPDAQRTGVATALVREAQRRKWPFRLEDQRYTTEGAALAQYLRNMGWA